MARLTIYLDETTLRRIERAARAERLSVSRWVRNKITGTMRGAWTEHYFELFGSLRDMALERPRSARLTPSRTSASI